MPYEGLVRDNGTWNGEIRFVEKHLRDPLSWGRPRRVFVNSMSDMFHENVKEEWLDQIFAVMALSPAHTFQVLTKRPERMRDYLNGRGLTVGRWLDSVSMRFANIAIQADRLNVADSIPLPPFPNVWLGVSVEDQETADERIPTLLKTPAAVRWVSYEPALGPVDFAPYLPVETIGGVELEPWLDWIVVGGESGSGARICSQVWIRDVVQRCRSARVPVFVKQLGRMVAYGVPGVNGGYRSKDRKGGDMAEWPEDLRIQQYPYVRARP